MKYLKLFNESVKDNLEKQINDLLININKSLRFL